MLMTERFRLSCVELKYLLGIDEIDPFLSALRSVTRDPSIRRDEWRITTVYLDRKDGFFARAGLSRPERRAEIRLREFFRPDGEPLSPYVWVESKQRNGTSARVRRFQLHRRLVDRLLRGDLEEDQILECQERFVEPDRVRRAVREVRRVAGSGPLVISGATSCLRTALEGGSPVGRLTLDREIRYHLDPTLEPSSLGPVALEERAGIVEMKYRGGRPPAWCGDRLGLEGQRNYSKFLILSALAAATTRRPSA
jgi:hypothetical protein